MISGLLFTIKVFIALFSRKFFKNLLQKTMRRKFANFHTVHTETRESGNYGNLLSRFFGIKFVKTTHLLYKLLKSWFDRKLFWWEKNFIFPQCVCVEITKIYSHLSLFCQKFRESNAFTEIKKSLNSWFDETFFQWERISATSALCNGV